MRGCWLLLAVTACFSPQPASGVPCDPASPVCPADQTCRQVGGQFTCGDPVSATDGPPVSDAPVGNPDSDAPATGRWTILQSHGSSGANLTIDPSTQGSAIIVAIETGIAMVTDVSDDATNSYLKVAGSRADDLANVSGLEFWYVRDAKPGAKTISVTVTNSKALVAWEVTGIKAVGDPIDVVATLDNQPGSTTPDGAPVTTTATGDFILSVAIVKNVISGLTANSDFTNDHTTLGNGWAHVTDPDVQPGTYQATWSQAMSGTWCSTTVAFLVDR